MANVYALIWAKNNFLIFLVDKKNKKILHIEEHMGGLLKGNHN